MRPLVALFLTLLLLALLVAEPHIDFVISNLFYDKDIGFHGADTPFYNVLHYVAYFGARILGGTLFVLGFFCWATHRRILRLGPKAYLFLFLALIIGPGLVANGILKDHWGRARPRETVEFGGNARFTGALIPSDQCDHNCSFVSGDGAFGFYLPVLAYVVRPPRSRRVFWSGMGLGALFSLARLAVGAHFASDTLFAAFFMQTVLAVLHIAMYGSAETIKCWRNWLFFIDKSKA
jgi:lipid A 4'-phosphatase